MHTAASRPLLYGYLRVLPGIDDIALLAARQQLAAFAEQAGFELAEVFTERGLYQRAAVWADLISTCRSKQVSDIAVVGLEQFHAQPELAEFMRDELAERIQGTVWVVGAVRNA